MRCCVGTLEKFDDTMSKENDMLRCEHCRSFMVLRQVSQTAELPGGLAWKWQTEAELAKLGSR